MHSAAVYIHERSARVRGQKDSVCKRKNKRKETNPLLPFEFYRPSVKDARSWVPREQVEFRIINASFFAVSQTSLFVYDTIIIKFRLRGEQKKNTDPNTRDERLETSRN